MGIYSKIKQVCLFVIFFQCLGSNDVIWTDAQKERIASRGGVTPYQELPLEKKKVDSKNATIDQGTS